MSKKIRNLIGITDKVIVFIDQKSLWWMGLLMMTVTFIPWFVLKEGSVFCIHDQLDETILSYIFNARHLGNKGEIFPEMMGGINKTGMQPSAILFVPLYRFFKPFVAFLIQYITVVLSAYMGMYGCVKKITGSSIFSVVIGVCFSLLPVQPIYGLSVLGIPLLIYAFICLYNKKRIILAYALILFFALTTHLVLIGYVVLGGWACYMVYLLIRKKKNVHLIGGFLFLLGVYVVVNYNMFVEVFWGSGEFISHREEFIGFGVAMEDSIKNLFLNSSQHAESLHKNLILPIVFLLVIGGFNLRKKAVEEKKLYCGAVLLFFMLVAIAVFYAVCKSETIVTWKNSMHGFLRYFQVERVYFLYPSLWYLEFALAVRSCFGKIRKMTVVKWTIVAALFFPTLILIKDNSYFYMNVNQINNGSEITGYISWESYYAEDLMKQLDKTIGRDKSDYRVAHLGINPAPALMYGFYTVDGYSNNYSMEYKHQFRKIIEKELDKNDYIKSYFDTWGSRCYLFNNMIGNYVLVSKDSQIKFHDLDFNMEELSELGCEFLFSGGEILDAKEMGLEFLGYYETEESYWGVWLYHINK